MLNQEDSVVTQPLNNPALVNGCILVAEDDHVVQLVLGNMLESAGYKVDFTDNGSEAISALKRKSYDIVLMDCMMPKMDGFAATRFIRSGKSSDIAPGIPIIAMTGLSTSDDFRLCRDAGMNSIVNKPVNSGELFTAIEQCLGTPANAGSARSQDDISGEYFWDDEFLDSIIDRFLADVPKVLTDLELAEISGDRTRLRQLSHRLRGAADILGTETLSARACALEQAAETVDIKLVANLASELTKELQKLTAILTD